MTTRRDSLWALPVLVRSFGWTQGLWTSGGPRTEEAGIWRFPHAAKGVGMNQWFQWLEGRLFDFGIEHPWGGSFLSWYEGERGKIEDWHAELNITAGEQGGTSQPHYRYTRIAQMTPVRWCMPRYNIILLDLSAFMLPQADQSEK